MTNRLELNWSLAGFVDEQRYYCSEMPIDPENLPAPKVILDGEARSYIDTDIEVGKTYYVRVSSVKNGVEKLSLESMVAVGDKYFSNVVMISNMSAAVSGSLINDIKGHVFTALPGSTATIVNDADAYDGKALSVTAGIQSAASNDWEFDGKFTIETRFKFSSHNNYGGIICSAQANAGWKGWNLLFNGSSNTPILEINAAFSLSLNEALVPGLYYEIAIDRDENNIVRLYLDGVMKASGTYAALIDSMESPLLLGIEREKNQKSVCVFDAVRITKGVARYSGAYTPTQKPYFEF